MENQKELPHPIKSFYSIVIKRVLDILLSSIAVLLLSWLFIIILVLEMFFHGFPLVYKTQRPGKHCKVFRLYKFRSMTNERDENGILLTEDKRITKFGLFLRRTSIDELPELFNIIKGDMSIIGPRPLLVEYLDLYSPRHLMRQSVRPGLACVRIMPSDSTTWTWGEQFENDIYYIERISFSTDIKMVVAVIKEIFKGAEYRANDTRVPFDGKNLDETRSKEFSRDTIRYDSISK